MGWYGLDGSGSGLGPVEGSCGDYTEPSGPITSWEILDSCTTGGLSRRTQLIGVNYVITFIVIYTARILYRFLKILAQVL
jgi:hypothetical protein